MRTLQLLPFATICLSASLAFGEPTHDCFTRSDSQLLKFDVFQISAPPKFIKATNDYVETSPSYPGNHYTTNNLLSVSTESASSVSNFHFKKSYLLWVNRCTNIPSLTPSQEACRNTTRPKANGYADLLKDDAGNQVRSAFSTYDKANACTFVQLARVLGANKAEISEWATVGKISIVEGNVPRSHLRRLAQSIALPNGNRETYLVDVCIIEPHVLSNDSEGVMLDYEVWDDRTPEEAVSLIEKLHLLTKKYNKKLMLTTNPIPRAANGLDEKSLGKIIELVDVFLPTISSGASPGNSAARVLARSRQVDPWQSYMVQLNLLERTTGSSALSPEVKRKIAWTIPLNDLSLDEAKQFHQEIDKEGFKGIMLFRNFTRQGGSCERGINQIVACLTLSECNGVYKR